MTKKQHKLREEFLVFSKPHFGQAEIDEMVKTIQSGWVGTGPKVAQFEKDFKEYIGAKFAVAVNSCTAALHLSYLTLDLKPGDQVILPAMTFGATANAIVHAGGTPVFADIDPIHLCLDVTAVERAITSRTRAIVVVHFAGKMGPVKELQALCQSKGLSLIEDCAHSIETTLKDKHAGTFGKSGCFSFYANKNVSTAEGGMFVTDDEALADRVRQLALHGMNKDAHKRFSAAGYNHYQFTEFGFKYNMPDIAAALGIHQLRRIEENAKRRQLIWQTYNDGLKSLPIGLPAPLPTQSEVHALHLYQVRFPAHVRDQALSLYTKYKIGVGVHYQALPQHSIYHRFLKENLPWDQAFPHAKKFGDETISLPLGTAMTLDDAKDVIAATEAITEQLL